MPRLKGMAFRGSVGGEGTPDEDLEAGEVLAAEAARSDILRYISRILHVAKVSEAYNREHASVEVPVIISPQWSIENS